MFVVLWLYVLYTSKMDALIALLIFFAIHVVIGVFFHMKKQHLLEGRLPDMDDATVTEWLNTMIQINTTFDKVERVKIRNPYFYVTSDLLSNKPIIHIHPNATLYWKENPPMNIRTIQIKLDSTGAATMTSPITEIHILSSTPPLYHPDHPNDFLTQLEKGLIGYRIPMEYIPQ